MSKVIEDAAQDFAAINEDKASNTAHSYSKYDIADAYQQGAEFVQCQFTKEKVIEILKARNEKAFSKFQKYEYNRMVEAIATIEKLVPPDCFFL